MALNIFQNTAGNTFQGTAGNTFQASESLSGGTAAASTLLAELSVTIPVQGALIGASELIGTVGGMQARLSGTVQGSVMIRGSLGGVPFRLSGQFSAASTLSGPIEIKSRLAGQIQSVATLMAWVPSGLYALSQSERLALRVVTILHLVEWSLGELTLNLCDRAYRYRYGSTEILYEPYILDIDGLGEVIQDKSNQRVTLRLANVQYDGDWLIKLNSTHPFQGSRITIYELRLVDNEIFLNDKRTVLAKLTVDEVRDVSRERFTLVCSSRLYAEGGLGLSRITTALYPNADPDDVGKWRNVVYGSVPGVPCRAVKAGAVDTLAADLAKGASTVNVSGISRIGFPSSGTVQIDDEQMSYTGFSNNTFTGVVRGINGTQNVAHTKGATVFQVLSEYVYEVAEHPVKSIDTVYVDGIRQTSGYIAYTGRPGDQLAGYGSAAVIKFSVKPVIRKQVNIEVTSEHGHSTDPGSHSHNSNFRTIYTKLGIAASGSASDPNNAIDGSGLTSATIADGQSLTVQLESGNWGTLEKIVINAILSYGPNMAGKRLYVRYGGSGGTLVATVTAGATVGLNPCQFKFTLNTSNWLDYIYFTGEAASGSGWGVWDVNCEFHFKAPTASRGADGVLTNRTGSTVLGGNSSADTVIGQEVTADVQGYQDDSAGTITGTPNALIQRPDHVIAHILRVRAGFSPSELMLSQAGTEYESRGWTLSFMLHDVGTTLPVVMDRLCEQCRSIWYEWGGLITLKFLPDSTPDASLELDSTDVCAEPVFNWTPLNRIKTKLRGFYKRSYTRPGSDLYAGLDPDAAAEGYLGMIETGSGDKVENLYFTAVRNGSHVLNVLNYWLSRKSLPELTVELSLTWRAVNLEPGSYFSWTDPMFGAAVYRVSRIRLDRSAGRINITGGKTS